MTPHRQTNDGLFGALSSYIPLSTRLLTRIIPGLPAYWLRNKQPRSRAGTKQNIRQAPSPTLKGHDRQEE